MSPDALLYTRKWVALSCRQPWNATAKCNCVALNLWSISYLLPRNEQSSTHTVVLYRHLDHVDAGQKMKPTCYTV